MPPVRAARCCKLKAPPRRSGAGGLPFLWLLRARHLRLLSTGKGREGGLLEIPKIWIFVLSITVIRVYSNTRWGGRECLNFMEGNLKWRGGWNIEWNVNVWGWKFNVKYVCNFRLLFTFNSRETAVQRTSLLVKFYLFSSWIRVNFSWKKILNQSGECAV